MLIASSLHVFDFHFAFAVTVALVSWISSPIDTLSIFDLFYFGIHAWYDKHAYYQRITYESTLSEVWWPHQILL